MKLGIGKSIIKIEDDMLPLENFHSIHDELHLRLIWLKDKIDCILVSLEMTSLREYEIENIKNKIHKETLVNKEHIIITVSHSFSSPHIRSKEAIEKMTLEEKERYEKYLKSIDIALLEAIEQSRNKQEVKIGFQNAYCSVNVSRDMLTDKGWWLGANDLGISDKSVGIISFNDMNDVPICILYSYDVQSSIMDHSKIDNCYQITSDLIGHCSDYIEKQVGCLAFFMLGSAGDQSPVFKANHNLLDKNKQIVSEDIGKDGYVFVNALGKKLAYAVINALDKIETKNVDSIVYSSFVKKYLGQQILDIKAITPSKEYIYQRAKEREELIEILILNEIAIVMLKPELSSHTGMSIKSKSPYHHTFVCTMINGSAKYMPDQLAYDRNTYEAMNSMYWRGSSEKLEEDIIQYLYKIKGETNENWNK